MYSRRKKEEGRRKKGNAVTAYFQPSWNSLTFKPIATKVKSYETTFNN
ncbi:MAG: hypothetical protein ACRC62_10995 [Microcoleus sp.]